MTDNHNHAAETNGSPDKSRWALHCPGKHQHVACPPVCNRQVEAQLIYPTLTNETRITVNTACAAFHLGRKQQTLRQWACYESGPIRPVRINGRLAWRVVDLLKVLNNGGVA